MFLIKRVMNYLFYNPYKVAKRHSNIFLSGSAILLKSCTFRFDKSINGNSIQIGDNTMLGCNFIFESNEGEIKVGANTFVNAGTNLICRSSIDIGDFVTISWGCMIYDHNSHSLDYTERQHDISRQVEDYRHGRNFTHSKNWDTVKSRPIVIKNNAWIGFDSVILSGVTIGEGAIVGARSVVRENVEPWTVVAGDPAVIVKRLK